MIDTSKKPTATDISYRIRLLHSFAHTAALFAMDADYPDRAAQEAMQDHILLIDELCSELDVMAQVMDGYADYTDFEQLIPEKCEKPKSRAQLMSELFNTLQELAATNKQSPPPELTEERKQVTAEIISALEKLGVIPPKKAGDSQ